MTDCRAGKVLADASTVESYKIEEKGFIVCMVSKVCLCPRPLTKTHLLTYYSQKQPRHPSLEDPRLLLLLRPRRRRPRLRLLNPTCPPLPRRISPPPQLPPRQPLVRQLLPVVDSMTLLLS